MKAVHRVVTSVSFFAGIVVLITLACSLPQGALPTPTSTLTRLDASLQPSHTPQGTAASPIATPYLKATLPVVNHRIELRRVYGIATFYDRLKEQQFIPRGVNYFYLVANNGIYENRVFGGKEFELPRIEQDFRKLNQAGYNTVRIFLDLCKPSQECIVQEDGMGLNPDYMDSIVQVMRVAEEMDLVLILSSNDLPDGARYAQTADDGADQLIAGYRNPSFLTADGIQGVKNYWDDLLSELAKREAPFEVILGWELLNEHWYQSDYPPFSLDEGYVTTANGKSYALSSPLEKQQMAIEGMRHYIKQVRQVIQTHDPKALVTMGFFAPAWPNEWRLGDTRYVETAGLLQESELDFFEFHLYPGSSLTQGELVDNFGMIGANQKPILLGEVGALVTSYPTIENASRGLQDWIVESCNYGFDGWLLWGFYRAPEELGDATWGFADEDGLLLRSLAPSVQPDACQPTIIRGDNLAYKKPVKASASLTDQPAEAAVDGTYLRWDSGLDVPQWLEIDLGGNYDISLIRLTVAQWPDGETVHEIWVIGEDGELIKAGELKGWTSDGQVLEWKPTVPLRAVRTVRIVTTGSPSWVAWEEIEVLAP